MAEQGATTGLPAHSEALKRQLVVGVGHALAPLVRALSGCPIPELAEDPYGTIRTVLDDMEDLNRTAGAPRDVVYAPGTIGHPLIDQVSTGTITQDPDKEKEGPA